MFAGLFGFSGRIGRGGWWFAQLIGLLIIGIIIAAGMALIDPNDPEVNNSPLFLIILAVGIFGHVCDQYLLNREALSRSR